MQRVWTGARAVTVLGSFKPCAACYNAVLAISATGEGPPFEVLLREVFCPSCRRRAEAIISVADSVPFDPGSAT